MVTNLCSSTGVFSYTSHSTTKALVRLGHRARQFYHVGGNGQYSRQSESLSIGRPVILVLAIALWGASGAAKMLSMVTKFPVTVNIFNGAPATSPLRWHLRDFRGNTKGMLLLLALSSLQAESRGFLTKRLGF